ncbi:hypothetical protein [Nocardia africana]|uniref:Uncharacterized protein n=1 Tax=Nocardia africana TaxID=134964 RepID=A0A379X4K8_9NOCA|nr:hypothetical protein [Nocardia africana]MCC3318464.1 hypothetical protein [Nocardia africana]SUH71967.1 Uncharacterised protein [Nocardia africana]
MKTVIFRWREISDHSAVVNVPDSFDPATATPTALTIAVSEIPDDADSYDAGHVEAVTVAEVDHQPDAEVVNLEAHPAEPAPEQAAATADPAPVLVGWRAQNEDGSGNTYRFGRNCIDCDPTYDPMYRTGVPCRDPQAHAYVTVANWRTFGHRADVVPVYETAADTGRSGQP